MSNQQSSMSSPSDDAVTEMDTNQEMFEKVFRDPVRSDLDPAEMAVVERFRSQWQNWDVLELGSGDGRVAFTLGALAQSYLGIDYAPSMPALAQQRFGEGNRRRFQLGDARNLPPEFEASFDTVWFPFNGLDNVDSADRSTILRQVYRVLKSGGYFYFSCHSLSAMPFRWEWPRLGRFNLHAVADAAQVLTEDVMMSRRSRSGDLEAARRNGWTILQGPRDFKTFYSDPAWQVAQLQEHGFTSLAILDGHGGVVEPASAGRDESLHYLCQRS